MKTLAIDQSFTSCGIVVLYNNAIVYAERFVSNPEDDMFARAWQVSNQILKVEQKYKPDFIAIEGLAFGGLGDKTRDLAGLQYTIVTRLRFVEQKDVRIIPPTTVKKVATGKGNSKKELLLEALPKEALNYFLKLGVKKTTGLTDLCDAYWIGQAAIQGYQYGHSGVRT